MNSVSAHPTLIDVWTTLAKKKRKYNSCKKMLSSIWLG